MRRRGSGEKVFGKGGKELARLVLASVGVRVDFGASRAERRGRARRWVGFSSLLALPQRLVAIVCERRPVSPSKPREENRDSAPGWSARCCALTALALSSHTLRSSTGIDLHMPPISFDASDCSFMGDPSLLNSLTCSERYRMKALGGRRRHPSSRLRTRLSAPEVPCDSAGLEEVEEVEGWATCGEGKA